jgi:hypothetical protein
MLFDTKPRPDSKRPFPAPRRQEGKMRGGSARNRYADPAGVAGKSTWWRVTGC